MLHKNKLPLILSSFIILLPCLIGILVQLFCPEIMASEWSMIANKRFWNAKITLLVLFTLLLLLIHWICAFIILKDTKNQTQNDKIKSLGLWLMPIFSLIGGCTLMEAATCNDFGFGFVIQLFLCTLFFILGNFMPKCKPNHSIGIKLPWTLHSEDNWIKTHRITGMIWVACSVTMFLFLMLFESGFISKVLPILIVMLAGPMVFSALYYRKQVKDGSVSRLERGMFSTTNRSFSASSVLGALIAVVVAVIFISGTIHYRFDEETLTIKANYWEDATVAYTEIDSVEYRENDLVGKRIMGFGSFFVLMGDYENSEFGVYARYSYSSCNSCVVIHSDERVLIINRKDEDATKELYKTLLTKIE